MGSGASNVKLTLTPPGSRRTIHHQIREDNSTRSSQKIVNQHSPSNQGGDNVSERPHSAKSVSTNNTLTNRDSEGDNSLGQLMPTSKPTNIANTRDKCIVLPSISSGNSKLKPNTNSNLEQINGFERLQHLEQELAKCESQRLDALDQVQILEERLIHQGPSVSQGQDVSLMNETIHVKDQYIVKLEKDLKNLQSEANTTRLKLKKRVRRLTNQLHEVRQEASIGQMEMKQEIAKQKEIMKVVSSPDSVNSASLTKPDYVPNMPNHSKVIVELSNQLSEQEKNIASLETQIVEKDLLIERMKSQNKEYSGSNNVNACSEISMGDEFTTGGRLPSGGGSRHKLLSQNSNTMTNPRIRNNVEMKNSCIGGRPVTQHSNGLSDSDSDWDMSDTPSHSHSAPPRVRVESTQSTQSVRKQTLLGKNMQGDDDSITQYINNSSSFQNCTLSGAQRSKPHKKSVLKNHLQKRKHKNQLSALMGPSLAFAACNKEQQSDTSCEVTPRNKDPSHLPGFSKLTVINPAHR